MKFSMPVSACIVLCAVSFASSGDVAPVPAASSSGPKLLKTLLDGTAHDALFGISFDQGKGVAVGDNGAIFESGDGGLTWTPDSNIPTQAAILAVDRHGDHTIAVGQTGLILVQEAGQWKSYDAPDKSRLFSVSVTTSGTALAVGEFGTVIKSTDGGHTWTSIAPQSWEPFVPNVPGGNPQPHVYAAKINENGDMVMAGEFGIIVGSKDGGKSWQVIRAGDYTKPSIFALYLSDKGDSFAVGQKGDIERSSDHGKTWLPIAIKSEANFLGIAAKPGEREFVITGMRAMLRSTDGGATWTAVTEDDTTTDWYQAIQADASSGHLVAVGHEGKIIEIGDGG